MAELSVLLRPEGSGAGTFFGQGGGAENIKFKFRFAKKWPIICIN